MTEILNDLIRLFHERNVVEKIATAEDEFEVYEKEKEALSEELEFFKSEAKKSLENLDDGDNIIDKYEFLPEDALQISFICIMTDIDDCDIFTNWEELAEALRMVKGEFEILAKNIANFIGIEEEDKGLVFSDYETEELLEEFFS